MSSPSAADGSQFDEDVDISPRGEQTSNYHASGETARPNKWQGSREQWLRATQAERTLSTSLTQAEDEDLSIHLYNAHCLRRDAIDEKLSAKQTDSKDRWLKHGKWVPERFWTTWPEALEDVPEQHETAGARDLQNWSEHLTFALQDHRDAPSDLAAELIASMTRHAVGTYRSEVAFPKAGGVGDSVSDVTLTMQDDMDSESDDEIEPSTRIPVPMVDDDQTTKRLQPAARRILSQVDQLLIALHHSRQNQNEQSPAARSNQIASAQLEPIVQSSQVDDDEMLNSTSASEPSSEDETEEDNSAWEDMDSESHEDDSNVDFDEQEQDRLASRDWSEILSAAAICGWDADVVERARARCERLFGERMSLQLLGQVDASDQGTPAPYVKQEQLLSSEARLSRRGPYACPEPSCIVQGIRYEQRWRLNEHLKRAHHYENPKSLKIERSERVQNYPPIAARKALDLLDGVHLDGFMQPIERQPGWTEVTASERRKHKRKQKQEIEHV